MISGATSQGPTRGPSATGDGREDGSSAQAALLADMAAMDLDSLRLAVQRQQVRDLPAPPRAVIQRIPEVVDDYLRNFLLQNGMHRTLEMFEVEWYGRGGSRAAAAATPPMVPDNYLESAALLNRVESLECDLRRHAELTAKLTRQWTQAKKDRDFHRASHNRVVQERNRLERLLRQASAQADDVSPALTDLRQRCETLFKAKTLVTLEKERLEQKVGQLEKRVAELQRLVTAQNEHADGEGEGGAAASGGKAGGKAGGKRSTSKKAAGGARREGPGAGAAAAAAAAPFVWPADERPRPPSNNRGGATGALQMTVDPTAWACQEGFLAHTQAVTTVAMHPTKPAVASCSDDGTWRLSALPQGEAVLTSHGHQNWVSSVAFHPTGTLVATGSGDKTAKLWSLATNTCSATLSGHTDGVWSVDFQDSGALLVTGGLDCTARVWDCEEGRCRQTLRGHAAAVNSARWQPGTNVVCTGSADKTVALWDARMGCCSQTLHGHAGAVTAVATPSVAAYLAGAADAQRRLQLVSCDVEGVVRVWDLRTMRASLTLRVGDSAANHVAVDASGNFVAVASDDGVVSVVDLVEETVTPLSTANGHSDAVLGVEFDPSTNNFLVSCGADRTVRYWC